MKFKWPEYSKHRDALFWASITMTAMQLSDKHWAWWLLIGAWFAHWAVTVYVDHLDEKLKSLRRSL